MNARLRRTDLVYGLVFLGGAAALPSSLAWRDKARDRHALVAAAIETPAPRRQPVLAADDAFRGSPAAAARTLATILRDSASRQGALIEMMEPRATPVSGVAIVHIAASGSQAAMLRMIEALETRTPTIRLIRYRLGSTTSGSSVRLDAEAAMTVALP